MKSIFGILIFAIYIIYRSNLKLKINYAIMAYKRRFEKDSPTVDIKKLYSWTIQQSYINLLMFFVIAVKEIGFEVYLLLFNKNTFTDIHMLNIQVGMFMLFFFLILSFRMEMRLHKLRQILY